MPQTLWPNTQNNKVRGHVCGTQKGQMIIDDSTLKKFFNPTWSGSNLTDLQRVELCGVDLLRVEKCSNFAKLNFV